MKQTIQIVWFKRDLRLHDHQPLYTAAQSALPVLPLYIVETDYWQQPFASRRHWHFIHDCLCELRDDCAKLGQALVVRVGRVIDELDKLKQHYDIHCLLAHEENGNLWTYERDKAVIAWCRHNKIEFVEQPNNGVVRRLKSRDDWSTIRQQRMAADVYPKPSQLVAVDSCPLGDIPAKDAAMFGDAVPGITQPGGRREAVKTLKSFLDQRGAAYLFHISAPGLSERYCSRLSPHLAWGTLSVREAMKATEFRRQNLQSDDAKSWRRNLTAFTSRLSWRCHFMQKIEDQPSIESHCMHPAFEGLRSDDQNEQFYQAWQQGQTGYPLIDACMRNLTHEGWITFRMRAMLVSFASYHLWLDWRKTGYHLAKLFTDYEPGIHYSQLQMQSGVTGINTLRIYNPIKQSLEHDPSGNYIRYWLPELQQVSNTWIHQPWLMSHKQQTQANCIIGKDYPAPIVDHDHAIAAAKAKIVSKKQQAGFKTEANKVFEKLGSRNRPPRRRRQGTTKLNNQAQLGFEFE